MPRRRCARRPAAASAVALAVALGASGCEPSPGTDHDKGMREMDRLNDLLQPMTPVIPVFDRVGCDVCPVLCARYDLHLIPVPALVQSFRRQAAAQIREAPDGMLITPYRQQLERFTCIAMRHGDHGEKALLTLLDDDDDGVRFYTAWMAIKFGLANAAAVAVTRELANSDKPVSFFAGHVTRLWDAEAAGEVPVGEGRAKARARRP